MKKLLFTLIVFTISTCCCFSQTLENKNNALALSDAQKLALKANYKKFSSDMNSLIHSTEIPPVKFQKIKTLKQERDSIIKALLGADYTIYINQTRFYKSKIDSIKSPSK